MKRLLFLLLVVCRIVQVKGQTMEELTNYYQRGQWEALQQGGLNVLHGDSTNSQVAMLLGRAAVQQGQSQGAIPLLQLSLRHATLPWVQAWDLAYLGICSFRIGRSQEALQYLDSAIRMNATKNVSEFAVKKKLLFGFDDAFKNFMVFESAHMRFHFQGNDSIVNKKFVDAHEAAYTKLESFFHPTLVKKIDYFVWNDTESSRAVIFSPAGFSLPEEAIIHARYNQTPGHELVHVICMYGQYAPNVKTRLFNEGLAVAFDLTKHDFIGEAQAAVKKYGKEVHIIDLWTYENALPEELVYPVGGAWVDYLRRNASELEFYDMIRNQNIMRAQEMLESKLSAWAKDFDAQINGN